MEEIIEEVIIEPIEVPKQEPNFKISDSVLKEKLNKTKFLYLARKLDKDGSYVVDLIEYLFGEEQAEEIFNYYENVGDLTNFLLKLTSQIQSMPAVKENS